MESAVVCAFPWKADIENVPENLQTALTCSVVKPSQKVLRKKTTRVVFLIAKRVFFSFYPPPRMECDCIVQRRKYEKNLLLFFKNERDKGRSVMMGVSGNISPRMKILPQFKRCQISSRSTW
jgi:hypothetical protein